ncbi:hypothetical protein PVAP13_2NG086486 [Panicum virgatum]|uniref:Uncharacterized protein n=1 Tax=Panicum virgatum TaxID=38727 RepID=A0A8T0VGX5_PANVG|nr:hypothetical protein PVAP13_2NG086486 [Panicum virgatum]
MGRRRFGRPLVRRRRAPPLASAAMHRPLSPFTPFAVVPRPPPRAGEGPAADLAKASWPRAACPMRRSGTSKDGGGGGGHCHLARPWWNAAAGPPHAAKDAMQAEGAAGMELLEAAAASLEGPGRWPWFKNGAGYPRRRRGFWWRGVQCCRRLLSPRFRRDAEVFRSWQVCLGLGTR